MRRATRFLTLAALMASLVPMAVNAAPQTVNMVDGIGMIDYSKKPSFKVGDWVKYHLTGSSDMGMSDDYTVTVTIGGEERFWGEDGFWVETIMERKGKSPVAVATLMSYAIFGDSLPFKNMQLYSRKTVTESDENGVPVPTLMRRQGAGIRNRDKAQKGFTFAVDSVGRENVTVPKGTYNCKKVSMKQGIAQSLEMGDSTLRTVVRDERMQFQNPAVPITSLVREEVFYSMRRQTWKAGQSANAPLNVMDEARGVSVLVDFGTGRVAEMVPPEARKPLSQQQASQAKKPATKKPAAGKTS
jgi:hypothetical protein